MRRYGVVATVLLAFLLPSSPAAAVDGGTYPSNGVLYDDCDDILIPYTFGFPPTMDDFLVNVDVYAPDGTRAGGDFMTKPDPVSGNAEFFSCGSDGPGTYTVKTSGTWYDADYNSYAFTLPDSTFNLRLPRSRTTAKALGNFKVRVSVRDERPNGYFPSEYPTVKVQLKENGAWRTLGRAMFDDSGKGTVTFKSSRAGKSVRFVTVADNYSGSKSKPVTVRP